MFWGIVQKLFPLIYITTHSVDFIARPDDTLSLRKTKEYSCGQFAYRGILGKDSIILNHFLMLQFVIAEHDMYGVLVFCHKINNFLICDTTVYKVSHEDESILILFPTHFLQGLNETIVVAVDITDDISAAHGA